MSHVDDGTLHAYLDGETTPIERERLEAHLAGCPACRARLDEERLLIERAGRLLDLAAPPERTAPPFHELRRPRRGGGLNRPLAWAATIVLAIGIGWFARGSFVRQRDVEAPRPAFMANTAPPESQGPAPSTPPPAPAATSKAVDEPRRVARAPTARARPSAAFSASADAGAVVTDGIAQRAESAPPAPAQRLDAASGEVRIRGAAPAVQAAAEPVVIVDRASLYGAAAIHRLTTTWPIIEPKRARDVLGEDPAVIPGYAVRSLRSNPTAGSEIVVEQVVDSGVVLLFERRGVSVGFAEALGAAPRAAEKAIVPRAGERLARYVRSLRVEIAGSLPADSLSALLGLIR